ncbi:MAG TPA: DUF1428 domain-containing protein [Sphingobium sp.]
MSYMDGFVIPVPKGNKQRYKEVAAYAAPIFIEHGALRVVECWADDIKPGKVNDLRTAVIAKEGEEVVFSWIEWPDKETRDAGSAKVMADPRMQPKEGEDMPFIGERLIYGGFEVLLDEKA